MSIANYETLLASAMLRAVRAGEAEAVPCVSDLECLETSIRGKLELEYAGAERSDSELVSELVRRAVKVVFDARVPVEALAPVVQAFEQGWKVELSASMPSSEVLAGLDEIAGLREAALRLSGGESPARVWRCTHGRLRDIPQHHDGSREDACLHGASRGDAALRGDPPPGRRRLNPDA